MIFVGGRGGREDREKGQGRDTSTPVKFNYNLKL